MGCRYEFAVTEHEWNGVNLMQNLCLNNSRPREHCANCGDHQLTTKLFEKVSHEKQNWKIFVLSIKKTFVIFGGGNFLGSSEIFISVI